jgi:hypothetical protein
MPWRRQDLPFKGALHLLSTVVVETHSIEGSPFSSKTKQTRLRVAWLTMPSDRPYFGEPEPKAIPNASRNSVFVESGRQTHWIAESTAKQNLFKAEIPTL